MTTTETLAVDKLHPSDLGRLSTVGLRTRKLRAGLSALGIAIGVAAIVAVLGLSSSASAGLLNEISSLGTNLLVVDNGQTLTGGTAELPKTAPAMIGRITGVSQVEETGTVSGDVYRSPLIPTVDTNALSIDAASLGLLHTVGTTVAQGSYLNSATAREPVAVLGAAAAQRLGIDRVFPGERIWLDNMWFYVTGILKPAVLAPAVDSSVFGRVPCRRALSQLRRTPLHRLRARPVRPRQRGRQPARRHRQSGEPERGGRLPTVVGSRRPGRRPRRIRRPLLGPRRRRSPCRSGGGGQHHDHLGPRTTL